jgi:acetyl-CoA acetyltransferase
VTIKGVAVVGAAETTKLGVIPELSEIGLHADAALNAMADAGLKPSDIDGLATAGVYSPALAAYLGLAPRWIDGTTVGGCSFMLHVRHAAAAIEAGYCTTVLITHGESGRSGIGRASHGTSTSSLAAEFEYPYGVVGATSNLTIPALRYMKASGATEEDLARVVVIQREWAAMNPRATLKTAITVEEILNSEIIAWPFRKPMCCVRTDGGGALILTEAARAKDLPGKPVYVIGTGEALESPMVSMMKDFTTFRGFRTAAADAFAQAEITHADVDHLMIYDAFAHLPMYGLEDVGFCKRGEAKDFIRERHTAPGGKLPMNTNGGGLCYMHSGMYGMYAMQESVRQMRGVAPAQVADAKISVCVGVGGMFAAAGVVIFSSDSRRMRM